MSEPLISRSRDLRRLREEGFEIEVVSGHLLVHHVPYVTTAREVMHGTLVSTLTLTGDITTTPDTHVAMFSGETPCDEDGTPLRAIINSSGRQQLADGVAVDHMFSSKPITGYPDYYEKVTAYVAMLTSAANKLDVDATATTFRVVEDPEPSSVFEYTETASTRAGIVIATGKLALPRLAIVGLGGTGSYILDLVAKTPVDEIHLYDGDRFLQHNAFRSPGAPSRVVLEQAPNKSSYFASIYRNMRRGIVAHDEHITAANVEQLRDMDFVFLALDHGPSRKLIVDRLEEWDVAFIDAGMGVYEIDGALGGLVRVTASTPEQRDHVHRRDRISFGEADDNNEYRQNIQIADLNALNATLAVLKWKRLLGFYVDLELEHNGIYEIDGNHIINEDHAAAA